MVATVIRYQIHAYINGRVMETYVGNHCIHVIAYSIEKHKTFLTWSFTYGFQAHYRPRFNLTWCSHQVVTEKI